MMDEQELAEIEERVHLATPEPWEHLYVVADDYPDEDTSEVVHVTDDGWSHTLTYRNSGRFGFNDAEFIAAARANIPALIAEVRRLRAAGAYIVGNAANLADCGVGDDCTQSDDMRAACAVFDKSA
jgi:hypothetical protein